MGVEQDLRTRLVNYAGMSALVGERIYWRTGEQGASLPYIVFHRISAQRVNAMGSPTGTVRARFQFDIWAAQSGNTSAMAVAASVEALVRAALNYYSGTDTVTIEWCNYLTERDLYSEEAEVHGKSLDFEVVYQE